jgi:bifunctional DNase/RNase
MKHWNTFWRDKMAYNYASGRRKKINPYALLVIILLIIMIVQSIVLFNNYFHITSLQPSSTNHKQIPISTEGYEEVDVSVSAAFIHLTSGCNELIVTTNQYQTYSIGKGIEKEIDIRPTSHDLMKEITENFEIQIKAVKIELVEDGIYYANLILQEGNKLLSIDSKPSDAIAVAVRFDAPVYIKKELMNDSVYIC